MGRLDPTYIPHFQAIQRGEYSDAVTKADWPGGGGGRGIQAVYSRAAMLHDGAVGLIASVCVPQVQSEEHQH
jgi:hypothetical protein